MEKNVLEYKGYHTKVEFSTEEMVLRGKIEGINDLVNFECESVKEVEKAFQEAVEDYLDFCAEVGKEPDREYKGTFNVRISPELHKQLANVAFKNGDTLNASVEKAIREYVSGNSNENGHVNETVYVLPLRIRPESEYRYNTNTSMPSWNAEYFQNVHGVKVNFVGGSVKS